MNATITPAEAPKPRSIEDVRASLDITAAEIERFGALGLSRRINETVRDVRDIARLLSELAAEPAPAGDTLEG